MNHTGLIRVSRSEFRKIKPEMVDSDWIVIYDALARNIDKPFFVLDFRPYVEFLTERNIFFALRNY